MVEKKIFDYAIIVPVYNNEDTIEFLMAELDKVVIKKNKDFEGLILFCNDGSSDNSIIKLKQIRDQYSNVKIINFTKNFGQASAIYAGLKESQAKYYIITSADLQDPPEVINSFLVDSLLKKEDVIVGTRTARDDGLLSESLSSISSWIVNKLNNNILPHGFFDFVTISRQVRNILLVKELSNPFWQLEIVKLGFDIKYIPYERKKRIHGKSMWTISKKLKYFLDAIIGYSFTPLRLMSLIGIIFSFSGIAYSAYILFAKIYGIGTFVYGWAPLMIVILVIGGFQMLFLGIIGEYIWRIASQVNHSNSYIIKEKFDSLN